MERILIVDDEMEIITLLERILNSERFITYSALNGKDAINLMQKKLFNIIICDIRLPDIDGKLLIKEFKKYNPLCNIIMITGFSSMDNVVECIENCATDYFTKPFRDMDIFIETIQTLDKKIKRWKESIPLG